jgi:undecaprenyl-phosphate 4-deoxy-4-formamido-L-arabinose transferase
VDDGSRDRSSRSQSFASRRPDRIRVLELSRNFGQHPAILAGFRDVTGDVVVTLDADLQNPPEEVPKLLAKFLEGYDVVGGVRRHRQDSWARRAASRLVNRITVAITRMRMTDFGCMLRAYSRDVVDEINRCDEASTFIPALGQSFARRPTEIEVAHAPRSGGESAYSFYRLIRLNFDLMTGFSSVPIQLFGLLGSCVALGGIGFGIFLFIRRLIVGAEVEGVFTLFAILFTLLGVAMAGLGIVGEYVGRIYEQVRGRPRFSVRRVYGLGEKGAVESRESRVESRRAVMTRIAVFAYSDTGYECLKFLFERNRDVAIVVTHADDPDEMRWYGSVAELARNRGIEPLVADDPRDPAVLEKIEAAKPDLLFSFYYRGILPDSLLALPRLGAFNVHGSLLPKFRGRAPVNWAILKGESVTGATLHAMTAKPDAGDIVDQERVAIGPDDTAGEVQSRVTAAAVKILERRLDELEKGGAPLRPQHSQATTGAGRRTGVSDPHRAGSPRPVRAVTHPFPGAH